MISSSGTIVCLATSEPRHSGQVVSLFKQVTRESPVENTRALVRMLDHAGYHNLAFAIMKCAGGGDESPLKHQEMNEFINMAKRLLKNEMPPSEQDRIATI